MGPILLKLNGTGLNDSERPFCVQLAICCDDYQRWMFSILICFLRFDNGALKSAMSYCAVSRIAVLGLRLFIESGPRPKGMSERKHLNESMAVLQ